MLSEEIDLGSDEIDNRRAAGLRCEVIDVKSRNPFILLILLSFEILQVKCE
jgi:hypothetical protein